MKPRKQSWLRVVVHFGALIPLALLVYDAMHHHLTVNPIQAAEQRTGTTALVLLVLSLVASPLNTVLGWKQAVQARRPLGLYAFFYVCVHLFIFSFLDYSLDPGLIWEAIAEKRFVLVGFTAFLLLIPLAVTSTKGWQRRLGKRWTKLHRLIYLIAPLVIVHYLWSVKADYRRPLLYGLGVAALLILRLPRIKQWIRAARTRFTQPQPKPTSASTTPEYRS